MRRTAFRLDPALHQQLSNRALQTKTSKGNVVLDAVESAHAAGLLERDDSQQLVRKGLFLRAPDRADPEPTVLVEIRLTAQALRTVDDLVETTGQPTRTRLFHVALAHYLEESA